MRVAAINRNNREVKVNWVKVDDVIRLEVNNKPKGLIIYYHKALGGNKLVAKHNGKIVGTSDYYKLGHFKTILLKELFNIQYKFVRDYGRKK